MKQLHRNHASKAPFVYRCHTCSKSGKTGLGLDDVLHLIDVDLTISRYGKMPVANRRDRVVIRCEDCSDYHDVIAGNVLHQARRHRMNGRSCLYKCFDCGVKRPDAMEKSAAARASQLASGFRSGLEIATSNRLDALGIRYEHQHQTDMYVWDFFLPDHSLLIDVNGEYWHSLKRNSEKDRSKLTYVERHRPEYRTLVIEERHFLNPSMVDKIILSKIGVLPPVKILNFDLDDVVVRPSHDLNYVQFLNSFHYAQCGRKGKYAHEAVLGNLVIGVCKFNSVTRKEIATSLGLKCTQVLELDRFCIHPSYQKKNFASWLLARCIRSVLLSCPQVLGLVSFADSTFGHSGTIYKASNWKEVGTTRPSYHYMDSLGVPINKKTVYNIASKLGMKEAEYVDKYGLVRHPELPKIKFIFMRDRSDSTLEKDSVS